MDETTWGRKLLALVNEVHESVFSGKVEFEKPRMIQIPKGYKAVSASFIVKGICPQCAG